VTLKDAESFACSELRDDDCIGESNEIIRSSLESLASECDRQVRFYWKAAGGEEPIDRLVLSGGGACVRGLARVIRDRTGIECEVLNPFKDTEISSKLNLEFVRQRSPLLGVATGLALRRTNDRIKYGASGLTHD
jgi:type IV pilus assembly protein PilM